MGSKTNDALGNDPIGKLLLHHAIPAALGVLVMSIYSMVDTMFVGQYVGGIGIAAVTIVAPITFLVSSLGFGIGTGGASLISIALGKGDKERANQIFGNQITMTLLIGALILLLGFVFFDEILLGFGASANTLAASREYFEYSLIGLPFYMGQLMLLNVLRAEDIPIGAMTVLAVPALINIALDSWFIAGLDMGLQGAALATAISQALGLLLGMGFILFAHGDLTLKAKFLRPVKKTLQSITSLGSVQFFAQSSMSIVVVLANNVLLQYGGDVAVSTYGLMIRIMMFAFFPVIGIVQGFLPIAGYNYGAGNKERLDKAIRLSFRYSNIIALGTSALILGFSGWILGLFTDETPLLEMASFALIFAFSAFPLLGIQLVSNAFFQATNQPRPALLLNLAKQAVVIACMFILPLFWGLDGVWYTFPVSEVVATALSYSYFRRAVRRQRASVTA